MSFGSGDARKRPGIFDSFRAAMTPAELPPDDGKPIAAPRVVTIAAVMSMLAGVIFLFIGSYNLITLDQWLELAKSDYKVTIATCDKFGGIGAAAVVPAAPADDVAAAQACQGYPPLDDALISSARTNATVSSVLLVVIGALAGVGGWLLRKGARWSRLLVAGAVVLSIAGTLQLHAANLLTLVATLFLIVAVMLCYIGKGAVFFARLKARRTG